MYPKQLLPLVDEKLTMLQQTVARVRSIPEVQEPIVVCNEEHRFIVAEQLKQFSTEATILLEPVGRNTAPAIAAAALHAIAKGEDPILLVLPADHLIVNNQTFSSAVESAVSLAKSGYLVTFGITPTHPETGYGYIQAGDPVAGGRRVAAFHEKPTQVVAQSYLDGQSHFWNGGIFAFRASVYLDELRRYAPSVLEAVTAAMKTATRDLDFVRINQVSFEGAPSISIDYAVMEKTDKAAMVELDCGWSDVGSWDALWKVLPKTEDGNVTQGDVVLEDTSNSLIFAESKLVSTLGVKSLVVVQTDDAVLVADRASAQSVKTIVEKLESGERTQSRHHRKVYRPWGWYDSIDVGEQFQVKRIMVNPGAKLSVQMHKKRAEHWVVVSGVAEVLNGDQVFTLTENESTYIPIGAKHSLRNPDDEIPLEIIEVQTGTYLGEDDIVRFEDLYGRLEES
jgi:mannose-1-phosphate guanylyltransferase/mannose-6-phosphate isomerase